VIPGARDKEEEGERGARRTRSVREEKRERGGREDQWIKPNPITPVGLQVWSTGADRVPRRRRM